MGKPIAIAVVGDTRDLIRELGKGDTALSSFGNKAKTVGKVVGAGLLVAGAAVIKFGIDSVQSASKAQQSLGATETVFGRFADKVVKESDRAADAVGLSANEYRESANLIGSLFKNQGVEMDKLAGKTDNMIRLGSDLSATFGGTTASAVEALGAAFKGEFDQLERYGVSLKQSDVNARLAAKGQDKLKGSALKLATQQAKTSLIMEQAGQTTGAFANEADTLAGAQQRLDAKIENVKARIGTALLPVLTKAVNLVAEKGVPALEDFAGWLEDNSDEIGDLGKALRDNLLPPLRTTADLVEDAVKLIAGLPGPVKDVGIQAGIAALLVLKFGGSLRAGSLAASAFVTNVRNAETRTAALGTAARTAAGIAGMTALIHSTQTESDSLGFLETAAGGALTGFSVAGAPGGVIGLAAGALIGLAGATQDVASWTVEAEDITKRYADTLDELTGATTRQTRARILDRLEANKAFQTVLPGLTKIGIAQRDVVSAIMGEKGARKRIAADILAYDKSHENYNDRSVAAAQFFLENILPDEASALRASIAAQRERIATLNTWKEALAGIPKKAFTELKAENFDVTLAEIRALGKEYDLTPRQIKTIIRETGAEETKRKVKDVNKTLAETGKAKPNLQPFMGSLLTQLLEAERTGKVKSKDLVRLLRDETGKAKPNLLPFKAQIISELLGIQGPAGTGGRGIGNAMEEGVVSGFAGTADRLGTEAYRAVQAALASARKAAEVRSPSKKMMEIGEQLGLGLQIGLADTRRDTEREARRYMSSVLTSFDAAPTLRPKFSSGVVATSRLAGAGTTLRVTLTAEQVHQLERGRQISLDLKAWQSAGGS